MGKPKAKKATEIQTVVATLLYGKGLSNEDRYPLPELAEEVGKKIGNSHFTKRNLKDELEMWIKEDIALITNGCLRITRDGMSSIEKIVDQVTSPAMA
jgi:hypothetical protein